MKRLLVGVVLGAMLVSASIALASIPDSSGVIHGCYQNSSGHGLRVINTDAGEHCANNETSLTWNQVGPIGPTGTAEATGAVGPIGPAGVSGYEVVQQDNTIPANTTGDFSTQASCPVGKTAISGGLWVLYQPIVSWIKNSRPNIVNPREWTFSFHTENTNNFEVTVRTYAICATV